MKEKPVETNMLKIRFFQANRAHDVTPARHKQDYYIPKTLAFKNMESTKMSTRFWASVHRF